MHTNDQHSPRDKRYTIPLHPTGTLLKRISTLQQSHRDQILLSKLTSSGKLLVINGKDKSLWGKIMPEDLCGLSYGIITNYHYFPHWESEGRPTPIQVVFKPIPVLPQRLSLAPIENNQDNLRSLIITRSLRIGRLTVQRIYLGGNEVLCLYDNQTKKPLSLFPPDQAAKWLKWKSKNAQHALYVSTDWHVTLSSLPRIEVTVYPYWSPSAKKLSYPPPFHIQAQPSTEQIHSQNNQWLDIINAKDADGGGHAPARRHQVREVIRALIAINPTDRATFDCLPRKDIAVWLEITNVLRATLSNLYDIRLRQAGHTPPIQSSTTIPPTNSGPPIQTPKTPQPTTALWTLEEASTFLQASPPQIQNLIKKYPHILKKNTPTPLIYADRLALQVNQHCDYKTTMLTVTQVAAHCRCSATAIGSLCQSGHIPSFNLTALTTAKTPKHNCRRISPKHLENILGVPLHTQIISMNEAIQLFSSKHSAWSDSKIRAYITKHSHSLVQDLPIQIKIYAAKDIETLAAQIE